MNRIEIKGIIPPIITPMHADESINTAELRRQVDRQIENGVHALFCFGTNGEGYILDGREKQLVLETVIEQANGRVPVYAGTGCVSTRETIAQSRMARDAGADVLSIITPSFAAASQQELYDHYRAVAEAVDIPIVLYNIPARTGNALAPETVARLSRIENIVGAKDSSGNWDNMKAYLDGTRGSGFAVLSGNDGLILDCLKTGGRGGVAGCANVTPAPWRLFMIVLPRAIWKKRRNIRRASRPSAHASNTATRIRSSKQPWRCWATTWENAAHRSTSSRKKALPRCGRCFVRMRKRGCTDP